MKENSGSFMDRLSPKYTNLSSVAINQPQGKPSTLLVPISVTHLPSVTLSKAQADCISLPTSPPMVGCSEQTLLTSAPHMPEEPFSSLPLATKPQAGLPCSAQPPSFSQAAPSLQSSTPACECLSLHPLLPLLSLSWLSLAMPEQAQGSPAGHSTCVPTLGGRICFLLLLQIIEPVYCQQ